MGHRLDHKCNSVKYFWQFSWGTWSFLFRQLDSVIEGLWSFDLFLFCQSTWHATMVHFWRQQVDETLGVQVWIVCFFMHVYLELGQAICWLILHTNPKSKHDIIWELLNVREFKVLDYYNMIMGMGIQVWIGGYLTRK